MHGPQPEGVDLAHRAGLRLPEPGILGAENDVADADEIKPARHAVAVYGSHGGLPQPEEPHPAFAREVELPPGPHGRAAVRASLHVVDGAVSIPEVGELVQVVAGAEVVPVCLDQQDAGLVVKVEVVHHQVEFVPQLARQGVAFVGAIERHSGDAVFLLVDKGFELHGEAPG